MNTAQKTPTKFVLVRWLSDETVGVMPLSATKTLRIFGSVVMAVQGCSPKGPGVGSRSRVQE